MRLHVAAALAAAALAAVAGVAPGSRPSDGGSSMRAAFAPAGLSAATAPLSSTGAQRLASASWWGGAHTAATGENVTVYLSESYARDPSAGQRWADFFAGLLHDRELETMRAYVAPIEEVQSFCGPRTLGCYGGGTLVTIGEPAGRLSPSLVATHEYGHHVASSRSNPPWRADAWGPKRWASHTNICARAAAGAVFPGDEGSNYELNPGEGFAEVYRVLNETRNGATSFEWPVVDTSFAPDAPALEAAEADVLRAWTAPATTAIRRRFTPAGRRTWSLRIPTPLDGDVEVVLRLRAGAGHELALASADGRRVLARGLWSRSAEKSLRYTVCGERAVIVRVTRTGRPDGFSLRISRP